MNHFKFFLSFTTLAMSLLLVPIKSHPTFGYISYFSHNIGDDIQSLAAKQFLPESSIPIEREFIGKFHYDFSVATIVNGWYMRTKDYGWYWKTIKAPNKSWPPAPAIDPLFIAIHFTEGFMPEAFSTEAIDYLKKHGPIGARDYNTLAELQKRNIPSYFSGCLTLTLENSCTQRNDIIYAVDLDQECINFIKSKTKSKIETLTHVIPPSMRYNVQKRLNYAAELLEKYKRAKCVVTTRLHASMPCLAFKTPVLLINTQKDQYRFDGLRELARNCSKEEFLKNMVVFDFDNPAENPKDYLTLRENLVKTVTEWVQNRQQA